MAKKSNHKTIVFLQDFSNKSEGDTWTCDGMIASSLVSRGVAEYKLASPIDEEKISEPAVQITEDHPQIPVEEVIEEQLSETSSEPTEEGNIVEEISEPAVQIESSKPKSSSKTKNKK
jgi:hypothetical protein